MSDPTPGTPPREPDAMPSVEAPRAASLRELVSAVLWSFFGVRKGDAMRRDAVTIKPYQVIIVGVILAAAVVVGLVILVHIITRNA
jgi:hypothetical protein